ncbi:MAG: HNH endonuclease [Paraclostridium sp.]
MDNKYKEYLKSDEWKRIKKLVLERDNNKCILCDSEDNLHIHHKTYQNIFKEIDHMDDLITLCSKCHTKEHKLKPTVSNIKLSYEPFIRINCNLNITEKYLKELTQSEKGNLYDIICRLDSFGRIKYGDNYQQYCRNYQDLSKVLDVNYNTFRKRLLPKLKSNNIIRISNRRDGEYVTLNPLIAINGKEWDKEEVLTWIDVIVEHNLISTYQINNIINK